jgi:hypothetical protein
MAQIIGTGKQRAGKNSRINVGATRIVGQRWNVTWKGDDLDTVNFESGGLEEGILGIEGLEWSMAGDWDAGTNPFDDPPGLYPRDDLAGLEFYENVTDNVGWDLTYARVRSATNGAEVRGKVSFEASGMSQGSFTPPAGSV